MKKISFPLLSILLLVGCMSISVLPTADTVYESTTSLEIYWEKPEKPYFIISKISVRSDVYSEKHLFERIKIKAMESGAHALLMFDTSTNQEIVGFPGYGGGTHIIPFQMITVKALAIRFK